MDQSKKTMRHFYCRDVLWETFEQMANDFDCSIDYLINEAMRFYARSKNYQAGPQSSQNLPAQPSNGPQAQASRSMPSVNRPPAPPQAAPRVTQSHQSHQHQPPPAPRPSPRRSHPRSASTAAGSSPRR